MGGTINERILKVIQTNSPNETMSSIARRMDIQPHTLRSLNPERDYVSSPFIVGLLKAFPDTNPYWLLFGEGDMRVSDSDTKKIINSPGSMVNLGDANIQKGNMIGNFAEIERENIELKSALAVCQERCKGLEGQVEAYKEMMDMLKQK